MSNPLLNKQFVAEAAINQFRIVKFGSTDDFVVQGAAVGDALIGICNFIAPAAGERVDIILAGIGEVQLGGTVTRGGLVTSNATGQGVAAAPAQARCAADPAARRAEVQRQEIEGPCAEFSAKTLLPCA